MITGEDFLALAEIWISAATEAEWRSAVSRAYYAAFHVGRDLLRGLGFRVPRGDRAHAYLWLRLSNCGDPQIERAGSDLSALRRIRNQADYDVDQTVAQADALLFVQSGRLIIDIFHTAAAEPTRSQITDTMKIYERDILRDVTWQP